MKNFSKIVLIVCSVIITAYLVVLGVRAQVDIDERDLRKSSQAAKCSDDITFEIDGFLIKGDRSAHVVLADGTRMTDLNRRCDIEELPDVVAAMWRRFGIAKSENGTQRNSYQEVYKKWIEQNESSRTVLSNGTVRLHDKKRDSYFLPLDKAPTADKKQIFFYCDGNEQERKTRVIAGCDVSYVHPNGLVISYRISRKDYSENDFIAADQEIRHKLQEMIISTPKQGE